MQLTKINENQRLEMVHFALEKGIVQAAQKYGTSSKTVAKWLKRFQNSGLAGLQDIERSSPAHPHNKVNPTQLFAAVALKRSQPEIRAKEIIARLNLSCSESLLYRKLRAAINAGDSFYDKDLTRTLKNQTIENPYYLFTHKFKESKDGFFITGAVELNTGIIHLCYGHEQSALSFTLFVDYLLFYFTTTGHNLAETILITGQKINCQFLDRIVFKHKFSNLVVKQRATAYLKRHYPSRIKELENLLAGISKILPDENREPGLLFIIADYNRSVVDNRTGKSQAKLLFPIQLSNFISDTEIIVNDADYWKKANLLSSILTNQIYALEEKKNQWLEKAQFEKALKTIDDILLLKESFSLESNSGSGLLYKKISLLKNLSRIDDALQVFAELFKLIDPADRVQYLGAVIEQAAFNAAINQQEVAEKLLADIGPEICAIDDDLSTGNFLRVKAVIKSRQNLYWQATLLYTRALKVYERCAHNSKIAAVYYELLKIFMIKGDFAKARLFGNKASDYAALTSDYQLKAAINGENGILYFHYNSFNKAKEYYNRAMEIYKINNDVFGIINTYLKLGNIYAKNFEFKAALQVYQQVSDLAKKYCYTNMHNIVMNNLGIIHSHLENYKAAEPCLKGYLKYVLTLNNSNMTAGAYGNLGLLSQKAGKWHSALVYFNKALKISREVGFKHYQSAYQLCCAEIYYDLQKFDKALKIAVSALNIAISISQPELIFHTRLLKIRISLELAIKQFKENCSQALDLRSLNALEELYRNSGSKREKIIAGYILWQAVKDLHIIIETSSNLEKKRIINVLKDFNSDLLATALLDMLNSLPKNERESSDYRNFLHKLAKQ